MTPRFVLACMILFDSVEYDVFLYHLYSSGINGKAWRLIKKWYTDPLCSVSLNGQLSTKFTISKGMKQGSVLSPAVLSPVLVVQSGHE